MLLSLCTLCGTVAAQNADKQAAKERKAIEKAQKKLTREQIRTYESLRNKAVEEFARQHPPRSFETPGGGSMTIRDVVCAGDKSSGKVLIYMTLDIPALYRGHTIGIGQRRNKTCTARSGEASYYGSAYITDNYPRRIIVTLYDVPVQTSVLESVEIELLRQSSFWGRIILHDVAIYWTESDKTIRDYVRNTAK